MQSSDFSVMRFLAMLLALLVLQSGMAKAGERDAKGEKEQVRRLQEQKRSLEMEKKQLLQEKNDLMTLEADKRKTLEASLGSAELRLRSSGARAGKLAAEVAEAKARIASGESEMERLKAQLAAEKASNDRLKKELDICSERNTALYRQGRELIEAFGRHGECDAVVRAEPMFGLGQVTRENALEAQRDVFEEQRYRAPSAN